MKNSPIRAATGGILVPTLAFSAMLLGLASLDIFTQEPVQASVAPLQDMHDLYVYPEMNLQWDTYYSLLGHSTEHTAACFRCHNGIMHDADGIPITTDCNACHFVLADKEQGLMILRILEDR
ncbi:MAG: hypothetical protein GY879_12260 [Planctomycetes bacterium]|nr:hypothetical protein [Planctomycetota bacterium]MCP4861368.1 hypothetical protein [Planctomycetota bacterium]